MQYPFYVKFLTLTCFFSLIALFIYIKMGYLKQLRLTDNVYLQLSPNGGAISNNPVLSQKEKDSIEQQEMILSSSKSMVHPMKIVFPNDTLDSLKTKAKISNPPIQVMPSSKLAPMFQQIKIVDSTELKERKFDSSKLK